MQAQELFPQNLKPAPTDAKLAIAGALAFPNMIAMEIEPRAAATFHSSADAGGILTIKAS